MPGIPSHGEEKREEKSGETPLFSGLRWDGNARFIKIPAQTFSLLLRGMISWCFKYLFLRWVCRWIHA